MSFEVLKSRLLAHADRVAIISAGRQYRYAELAAEVERREQAYRAAGCGAGSLVTLIGDFSFDALASLLALLHCQATVIPLTGAAHEKLRAHVDALAPDGLVDTRGGAATLQWPADTARAETPAWRQVLPAASGGLIVFTSGSTGAPKAIVHDIDALCYRYVALRRPFSAICFLLFDHMGGINTVLHLLFQGGTAVHVDSRQVETVCQAIEQHRVEVLPATPSFLSQLLLARANLHHDLSSLRIISYGTEVMSAAVLVKLNTVLPGCVFKQTYGLSETGVLQIKSRANDSLWFRFSDAGVSSKIVDGVLWIKTQSNLRGKLLFSDSGVQLEAQDSAWFCTNDLVATDGDDLMILGRQTDIVNVGGLKVYPSEVENCLQELPFVDDAFVKGKKNALLGQIVVAYVQLNEAVAKADAERLIKQHCAGRLERYKVPSQLIFQWENFVNDRFKKVRAA
jgi:long-chain acyl-CoA synthetase